MSDFATHDVTFRCPCCGKHAHLPGECRTWWEIVSPRHGGSGREIDCPKCGERIRMTYRVHVSWSADRIRE